ncbi:MAG: hypothetical protein AAB438_02055 [Patescibacteria group bacterium]
MNKVVVDLFANGYFSVPISEELTAKINRLSGLWNKFYGQTFVEKEKHFFSNAGGYEYRPPNSLDHKETFHLSLMYELPEGATNVDVEFVTFGKKVIQELLDVVKFVADTTSAATKTDITDLVADSISKWTMRFLHYFPVQGKVDLLAAPHIDKGMLTVHLTESTHGFQALWQEEWQDVPGVPGFVFGYAGMLGQYHTKCGIPALCHQVVASPESMMQGRTSIVLFVDAGEVRYDKGYYGSSQEVFPAGENYAMPFEAFEQFFIPAEEAVL